MDQCEFWTEIFVFKKNETNFFFFKSFFKNCVVGREHVDCRFGRFVCGFDSGQDDAHWKIPLELHDHAQRMHRRNGVAAPFFDIISFIF